MKRIGQKESEEEERHPLAKGLSVIVLEPVDSWPEQSLEQITESPEQDPGVTAMLRKFARIEFIDETHAIRTDMV